MNYSENCKIEINIDSYLTEEKLGNILSKLYSPEYIHKSYKIKNTRYSYDYMIDLINGECIEDYNYIVEFDGDSHYRDSLVMMRDNIKDNLMNKELFKIVRIPYFVQLNKDTLFHYFNGKFITKFTNIEFNQNYSHGWVDSKFYPASFCELGTEKFLKEYFSLPKNVSNKIKETLIYWCGVYDEKYIINSRIKKALNI